LRKYILIATVFLIAITVMLISVPAILAADPEGDSSTSVQLTLTVTPSESSSGSSGGGGGGTSLYPIYTSLFGVDDTYYTEYDGSIRQNIEGTSQDGSLSITIPKHITALDKKGKRLKTLEAVVSDAVPDPPADANIIGLPYDFSPAGAIFSPPIELSFTYNPDDLPEGVIESDLVLAFYDSNSEEWVELICVVGTETYTITAQVSHFTVFAALYHIPIITSGDIPTADPSSASDVITIGVPTTPEPITLPDIVVIPNVSVELADVPVSVPTTQQESNKNLYVWLWSILGVIVLIVGIAFIVIIYKSWRRQ